MPQETNYLYSRLALNLLTGKVSDLSSGSTVVRVALLSDSYTLDQHNHDSWDNVKSHEASGPGYYSGGVELQGLTVIQNPASMDEITFSFSAVDALGRHALWGVDGQTGEVVSIIARYAVVYDDTPVSDVDKKLVAIQDFGVDREAYMSEFGVTFHEEGLFKCTVATP